MADQVCQDCGELARFDWDGFILPCDGCGFDQLEDDRPTIIQNTTEYVVRLRRALTWYAEPVLTYAITQYAEPRSAVHGDGGHRAREALANH